MTPEFKRPGRLPLPRLPIVIVAIFWAKWRDRKMKDTIVGIVAGIVAAVGAVQAAPRVFSGGPS